MKYNKKKTDKHTVEVYLINCPSLESGEMTCFDWKSAQDYLTDELEGGCVDESGDAIITIKRRYMTPEDAANLHEYEH